ncbi:MAG TPA: flagellar biosynthesis anti-sigma factor FlgM [Spirochaetota bacterium]|nr:flagellar biosynthesis anti-sigma factor FlgM [Spirochaetota bacterium]HNT12010.1 flagellar biosynthesis anti-sigma factor FlgM [Spirochaetota bacterium]HNV49295.1 flagellar biosynthesis anti-sigma factor FlgM [Spirochaetota bacterium]HOS41877.1 flagellar biosynthesis anti-sigma factor FlgM [Spirochaetota bacterium]HPU88000.1 flagellar biosynthesis anti-sigma factor FlgM [Spirochaetota bacterium]
MVIDKIGNINNIIETKSAKTVSKAKSPKKSDMVEISSEGKKAQETAQLGQIIRETPDIRREKVEAIKAQIKDGTYDKFVDNAVLEMVADKIASNLLRR